MAIRNSVSRRFGFRGFTLLEFVIVVAILAILIMVARPTWDMAKKRGRETALVANLHVIRQAINQYAADKSKYPETLDALVDAGYFSQVPEDPIKRTRTWNFTMGRLPGSNALAASGIEDIHSTSEDLSMGGECTPEEGPPACGPYNTW